MPSSGPLTRKQSLFLGGCEPPAAAAGANMQPEHFPDAATMGAAARTPGIFAITDDTGDLWIKSRPDTALAAWIDCTDLANRYPDVFLDVLGTPTGWPFLGGARAFGYMKMPPGASLVDNEGFLMPDGITDLGTVHFEWQATGGYVPTPGRVTIDVRGLTHLQVKAAVEAAVAKYCPTLVIAFSIGPFGAPPGWCLTQWNCAEAGTWTNRPLVNLSPSSPAFVTWGFLYGEDFLRTLVSRLSRLTRIFREPWRTLSPICAAPEATNTRCFRAVCVSPATGDIYAATDISDAGLVADQGMWVQLAGTGEWSSFAEIAGKATECLCAAPNGDVFAAVDGRLWERPGGVGVWVDTGWGLGGVPPKDIGYIRSIAAVPSGPGTYDLYVGVSAVGLYRRVGGVGNLVAFDLSEPLNFFAMAVSPITGDLAISDSPGASNELWVLRSGAAAVELMPFAVESDLMPIGLSYDLTGNLLVADERLARLYRRAKNGDGRATICAQLIYNGSLGSQKGGQLWVDPQGRLLAACRNVDVLRGL